jgi:hypothetical protein
MISIFENKIKVINLKKVDQITIENVLDDIL